MALGLHAAPHHTVAHDRLTVFRQERWDDGVERTLTWGNQISGVQAFRIGAEIEAAVVQTDAVGRLDHARSKAHVIALNKAHHHAVFVGGREVNGAALHGVASFEVLRFFHVNELGAALQVSRV